MNLKFFITVHAIANFLAFYSLVSNEQEGSQVILCNMSRDFKDVCTLTQTCPGDGFTVEMVRHSHLVFFSNL